MNITYYCQTPAIDELCELYGPRWERMALHTRTALIAALGECAHMLGATGHSERLDIVVANNGYEVEDCPTLYPLLEQLDGELSHVSQVLSLIEGVCSCTPAFE